MLCENLYGPSQLTNAINSVLLEKFKISSLAIIPIQAVFLLPLEIPLAAPSLPTPISSPVVSRRASQPPPVQIAKDSPNVPTTGLVLDCGYLETRILPIYEGVPLAHAFTSAPKGSKAVFENLERKLRDWAVERDAFSGETFPFLSSISEIDLENIATSMCFVRPNGSEKLPNPSPWPKNTDRSLKHVETKETKGVELEGEVEKKKEDVPSKAMSHYPLSPERVLDFDVAVRSTAYDVLFDQDEENVSIASLVLDSLLKCPHDTRCELLTSLLVVGGTSMVPGFRIRLGNEIQRLMKSSEYSELKAMENKINYFTLPCPANYMGWVGASILGCVDSAFNAHAIVKEPPKAKTILAQLNL